LRVLVDFNPECVHGREESERAAGKKSGEAKERWRKILVVPPPGPLFMI
jgi:hypothetical protein